MTAILKNTLVKIWGTDNNPFTFMQLLAANGGVPNMVVLETEQVSMFRKVRVAFDGLAEEIHMMGYGYFDLLEDNGQMPRLTISKPANDNLSLSALKLFKAA